MKHTPLAITMATAISFAIAGVSEAADQASISTPSAATTQAPANSNPNANMERCNVVKDGKGMIREHKGDCKASNPEKNSCAGQNSAGEPEAWIFVPKGECAKINMGDCSGISQESRARLEATACNK
ncbi:MAG: DUF2282 domain-containing protein [Gammaproteobacteria bacterium]